MPTVCLCSSWQVTHSPAACPTLSCTAVPNRDDGDTKGPAEVAGDLSSYRETAGLDAFQINFHGNRSLDQLLQSMECFMQDVAPIVSGERIGSKS